MNRLIRGIVLAFLGGVVGLATGQAAEEIKTGKVYYVDSGAGSDDNDGLSKEHPWKSLDYVNQQVMEAGDSLLFKAGSVWKGQLKPQGAGTEERPIRIDKYGQAEALPRIDAEGKIDAALYLYNVQGWEVRHLELTNTGPDRKPKRSGAWVHIRDFGTAKHIVLDGLYIHDVNGSLVKDQGGGQGILLTNEGRRQGQSRFDGLIVENCLIRRCERNGIIQWGYTDRGRWYPNLNVIIRGNLLEEIPGDGIVPIGCDGAIVERNRMRNCTRLLPEGEAAAGIWPWACDNTVIQYNEVSDHKAPWDGQGFDSDWNCTNTLIQYNFSHDNEGGFLLICNNSEVKMPYSVGNVGTVIRYNLSINDGLRQQPTRQGIFSPTFHITGRCVNSHIYNNTIIVPKKPGEKIDRHVICMEDWGKDSPDGTRFENNIFYAEEPAQYNFGKGVGTVFVNNLYYGSHLNRLPDEKEMTADPMFFKPIMTIPQRDAESARKAFAGDTLLSGFGIKTQSPCFGKGLVIPDCGEHDLLGTPIPAEGHGLGTIEIRK